MDSQAVGVATSLKKVPPFVLSCQGRARWVSALSILVQGKQRPLLVWGTQVSLRPQVDVPEGSTAASAAQKFVLGVESGRCW